jgi:hypothetical protein
MRAYNIIDVVCDMMQRTYNESIRHRKHIRCSHGRFDRHRSFKLGHSTYRHGEDVTGIRLGHRRSCMTYDSDVVLVLVGVVRHCRSLA